MHGHTPMTLESAAVLLERMVVNLRNPTQTAQSLKSYQSTLQHIANGIGLVADYEQEIEAEEALQALKALAP